MTDQHPTAPREGDQRDVTFTATGGDTITVTATHERTWRGDTEPCVGIDDVCAILDTWTNADEPRRRYLWPSTERSDDDAIVAYLRNGRVVLDRWEVATDSDTFSLADLPALLPGDDYTLSDSEEP